MKLNAVKVPSKRKLVCYGIVVALLIGAYMSRHIVALRAVQFKDCVAAKYDLRRETNFRFLTGACTAEGKDGGQVYVNQLRAFGSDHPGQDVDHTN